MRILTQPHLDPAVAERPPNHGRSQHSESRVAHTVWSGLLYPGWWLIVARWHVDAEMSQTPR
jgi:hypothetical protein